MLMDTELAEGIAKITKKKLDDEAAAEKAAALLLAPPLFPAAAVQFQTKNGIAIDA